MTYPFVYYGAGGEPQCGEVGPSNYVANSAYANNMKSAIGDPNTRSMIFLKRQTGGNKTKFTLFASFRRSTLSRDSVSDRQAVIIAPEAQRETSASCDFRLGTSDQLVLRNVFDDGDSITYTSSVKLLDTEGFYNVVATIDGKNLCNMWVNGIKVSVVRGVQNLGAGWFVDTPRWNDSRYDICVGGIKGLTKPNAAATNPEWAFRGEICVAGLIDGVFVETPNLFGSFDERTGVWYPIVPDLISEGGNSFCLVGRDTIIKDAMRTYVIGGKPNELNTVSPNKDPIGMVLQSSALDVNDYPHAFSPLLGNNKGFSFIGTLDTAVTYFGQSGRLLAQADPYGLQANGNTKSLIHPDGSAGSLVFPNSPDLGIQFFKYTGTGNEITIPHTLGRKPDMVMIMRAEDSTVPSPSPSTIPYTWVRDAGNNNAFGEPNGSLFKMNNNLNQQFLSEKSDDSNLYIRGYVDPATKPTGQVGTNSTKGRHHDSSIFTIGSVTFLAVAEYSDMTSTNDSTGGGIHLMRIGTDGAVTHLDSKAHTRITWCKYFSLNGDHYLFINQRSNNPAVSAFYSKCIIYQINTATNKLGTKWETTELRDSSQTDIFIDGGKLVVTCGTGEEATHTDGNKALMYDFDETNGFHNVRNIPILNGRRFFTSFLVGTERYGVSMENGELNTFNTSASTGISKIKFTKWQTGSRTWSAFISSMEFAGPLRPEPVEVFTHSGRIYLAVSGSAQRLSMFNEPEKRGVYLYEFEIAKMRLKVLDFVLHDGAWKVNAFTQDGSTFLAVGSRILFVTGGGDPATILYKLSSDGNNLINVQCLAGADTSSTVTGVHANGKRYGFISNLGFPSTTAPNYSQLVEWDSDIGGFIGNNHTSNQLNKVGVDYMVMAVANTDNFFVDRVGTVPFRTFIPGVSLTFEEDGERYFVIVTQAANVVASPSLTDAQYDTYGKVLTYQYCKYRGTLVLIDELKGLIPDSTTKIFERNGERYMIVAGYPKTFLSTSSIDRMPTVFKWNKVNRTWSKVQTLTSSGAPSLPVEHAGSLYITLLNRSRPITDNTYPTLWKFNDTNGTFELLTASRTDQKHFAIDAGMFSKNGKLFFAMACAWYQFHGTINHLLLFEVNPATGVYTLVQSLEQGNNGRAYSTVHDVDGEVIVSIGIDNNTGDQNFGLFRFDPTTERLVLVYQSLTVDNTACPIVTYAKHNNRHLFFFAAYNGINPVAERSGASTIMEYFPDTKQASIVSTFYSSGLIQLLPFKEDGKLKFLSTFYWDVSAYDTSTVIGQYGNCHGHFSVFNDRDATIESAWFNLKTNENDFRMWFCFKERLSWNGPDYYYDISQGRARQRYLCSPTPITGSLGNVTPEGGALMPMNAPHEKQTGRGLFISSDKWVGGMEIDQRTGNKFLVQPLHSGGMFANTANPFNNLIKFSDNIKFPGKEKMYFGATLGGSVLSVPAGRTAFAATPFVIPGWRTKQKDKLQFEVTLVVESGAYIAFGLTTFEDKSFSNPAVRVVSPRAGATGLVTNTWEISSGDVVTFLFNYETRQISIYANNAAAIHSAMPEGSMCFFADQYTSHPTGSTWLQVNFGQDRFNFPVTGAKAPTAENTKQAYPIVRSKRFFEEGTSRFSSTPGQVLHSVTEFSPDLVMLFDTGHSRKHRWFYRGWGDNNYYSGQDFNGSLGTVLAGGISGFSWNDDGFTMRKNTDSAWSDTEFIHYLAWDSSRCSGMELIEYTGSSTDVILNLNNIEGKADAVIILSKNDAANRAAVIGIDMDNPGRNYIPLHTSAGIQLSTTTIVTFEDKKLIIPNKAGFNQSGKEYLAVVFKSVPGFSHFGTSVTTGEQDSFQALVGISPTASIVADGSAATAPTIRHFTSDGPINPGNHYSLSDSSKTVGSPIEFHCTGVSSYANAPANNKFFTMIWGYPWVYSQGR